MHLEGRMSVQAAFAAGRRTIQSILVGNEASEEKLEDVLAEARRRGIPVKHVPETTLDQLAHGRTHGGLLAICTGRPPDEVSVLESIFAGSDPAFLLLLEGADDPRNLGWTLRTAEALGVHGVLLKRRNWDLDETAVMRASSGAFDRLRILQVAREDGMIDGLRSRGLSIWSCLPHERRSVYDADLRSPLVLAVGGEKRGLSGEVRDRCTGFLSIPTMPGATSLSMSHAAAILMAEVTRQRRASTSVKREG